MLYTEGIQSPDLFRRWSAIALVAGALERRVWIKGRVYQTFPNLYTVLVSPPGVGKQVIEQTRGLWWATPDAPGGSAPAFHVAPDSITKAALLDTLNDSKRSFLPPAGPILTYHSMLVCAEEIQVLLPGYDQEFIGVLNKLFNNEVAYRERRRTGSVRNLDIPLPQLNLLVGATPAYFVGTFPEEAWTTGLARRIIMVYSSDSPFQTVFGDSPDTERVHAHLLARLTHLAGLYGQMRWHPDAAARLESWHAAGAGMGGPPIPTHSKLEHYNRSRTMHTLKLTIVSAVARTGELVIELTDVERAIAWLLEAETTMPDIFRAMAGRSDMQIIEEMHYFVQSLWAKDRKGAVQGDAIRRFLMARAPHDKIESLLMSAERANILARVAGTQDSWVPRPKHEHGVE